MRCIPCTCAKIAWRAGSSLLILSVSDCTYRWSALTSDFGSTRLMPELLLPLIQAKLRFNTVARVHHIQRLLSNNPCDCRGSKFACRLGFLGDIRNSKPIVAGQAEGRKFWFPTKKSSNST